MFVLLAQGQEAPVTGCNTGSTGINLFDCVNLGSGGDIRTLYSQPAQLVNVIVTNLFILAGILFFIILIYAGFMFIKDGTKGKDEAKQIIKTAITGLVVMFVSYWIVEIAEIVTGITILF